MKSVSFSLVRYAALLFLLTACQTAGSVLNDAGIQPGGEINGMKLMTGAKDAPPLWAFCDQLQQIGEFTTTNCDLPVLSKLGIGDLFALAGGKLDCIHWSALSWELSLDNQPLDLEAFGTFDYVMPAMPRKPSPLAEVFEKFTAWDIVLTNLTPGEHTLQGFAHTKADTYTWLIHLTIKADIVPTKTRFLERP